MIRALFALPLVLSSTLALAEMRLIQSPVGVTVTTAAITGIGSFSVKVPGTFSGTSSAVNTRYLSYVEIISDEIAMGDYIDGIVVSDDDGVIPVALRARFPEYPTIINFSSDTGVGTIAGYYLSQRGDTRISSFPQIGSNAREEPQPIPSGLYLKGVIKNAGLLSKAYRVNIVWGRVF